MQETRKTSEYYDDLQVLQEEEFIGVVNITHPIES
jgi:hypothetical protein